MHYVKQNKLDSERETLCFLSSAESTFKFMCMCVYNMKIERKL